VCLDDRCRKIELLVMDADGVLTDGSIIYSDRGEELKAFHVRDGSGLKIWLALGKKACIITGRKSIIVERRAVELGLTAVVQGADDKLAAFQRLLGELGLTAERAAYIGDDLPDLPVMGCCGLAAAVADACPETHDRAHYVTRAPGGRGAVRELIEMVLRAQGHWPEAVARFLGGASRVGTGS
jgi:3-deoxy-D-manno-octulosonate 8-phosphate phosphatase (KDO 8-P phosphatase)